MNTRKWSAVAAALTVTSLVTACSGGPNSGGDSDTLTLASVDQGSIEQVVAAFEAANPGVKVNFTTAGADQYQQQIRTQLASGTAPDVFSVWPGNGNPGATYVLAPPGYLLDLSDQSWASELPAGLQSVARYEGKTYNAVFGVNGIGAIYNEAALGDAGLEAPTTWSEVLAFCQDAAAKGTPAYALGIQDNWVTQLALYALVATTVYSEDPNFDTKLQAGQTSFAESEWTTALDMYIQMQQTGCFQENPLGTSYEASQQLVATGETLGIIQGNWVIALLKGINPSGSFVFHALPANDDPNSTFIPGAAGAGYGINAKTKNKDLALKFVNFVMSPEGMSVFNEAQGSLPALPDTGFKVDPSLSELTDFINAGKTVPFMDQLWPNPKVQQTMLSGLQEIFSGQTTPEQLLADMDADYQEGS